MDNKKCYTSPNLANRIKETAKSKGVALNKLLEECGLGCNTMSHLLHGRSLAFDSLAAIADYLDISVDYLLGRTENPESHKNNF